MFLEIVTGAAALEGVSIPIGWRFAPTDEELIASYLSNKMASRPIPAKIIKEIDASEFYSKHPRDHVDPTVCMEDDRYLESERYFFIRHNKHLRGGVGKIQPVGHNIGFWRFSGAEDPIFDADGNMFAIKIHSNFFSTNPKTRRTDWKMEEYRLTNSDISRDDEEEFPREERVVARIRRGKC